MGLDLINKSRLKSALELTKKYIDSIYPKPNLLINFYFFTPNSSTLPDQLPINQRKVSGTILTPGYFIDCWKLASNSSATLTKDGIRLNGSIEQILEVDPGGEVTASVLTDTGIQDASYDKSTKTFRITANNQVIKAAKLELGKSQTLAHKEGSNWILNDPPPNPALELLKCQKYQNIFEYYNIARAVYLTQGYIDFIIPVSVALIKNPTIINPENLFVSNSLGISEISGFTFSVVSSLKSSIRVRATKGNHGLTDATLHSNKNIIFDANL